MTDSPTPSPSSSSALAVLKVLLTRTETVTFAVAVLVAIGAALNLPARAGIALPEDALTKIVGLFFAVFVGAVFEGKYRADYVGSLGRLLHSVKFRVALLGLLLPVLDTLAKAGGITLPPEAISQLLNFLLAVILGGGALDAYRASGAAAR